jgi:hypothetical protein
METPFIWTQTPYRRSRGTVENCSKSTRSDPTRDCCPRSSQRNRSDSSWAGHPLAEWITGPTGEHGRPDRNVEKSACCSSRLLSSFAFFSLSPHREFGGDGHCARPWHCWPITTWCARSSSAALCCCGRNCSTAMPGAIIRAPAGDPLTNFCRFCLCDNVSSWRIKSWERWSMLEDYWTNTSRWWPACRLPVPLPPRQTGDGREPTFAEGTNRRRFLRTLAEVNHCQVGGLPIYHPDHIALFAQ